MRFLLPTLIALSSCTGAEEGPRVAMLEQAMLAYDDGGPRVQGRILNAHLGESIVICPGDGGYMAGSPGDEAVWSSTLQGWLQPNPLAIILGSPPLPIACVGQNNNLRALMGGSSTYALAPDGGKLIIFGRTDAFATSRGLLAVGSTDPGVVRVFNTTPTAPLVSPIFTSPNASIGLGNSLSWSSSGELLVGDSRAHAAGVIPAGVDGGLLSTTVFLPNPEPDAGNSDFGQVVLAGDVLGDAGQEYIVAAPVLGRVYVFSGTAHLLTLSGGVSFGAALAIEPGSGALWIGEPAQGQVWRYVGSQGTYFPAPPAGRNARFGAAIAIDPSGLIVVGAPDYGALGLVQTGAVFETRFDGGTMRGARADCVAGTSCTLPNCIRGTCVGGVFCQETAANPSSCPLQQQCEPIKNECVPVPGLDAGARDAGEDADADAGTPDAGDPDDAGSQDAGIFDAGISDAGVPDAGPLDPGVPDAGVDQVQIFKTCGCSSGGVPLLLLALAVTRRSRRKFTE